MEFNPEMWTTMLLSATSSAIFCGFCGWLYLRLKEKRMRLEFLNQEFQLQVAAIRHHYKNLAIGIQGFSNRIKRKLAHLDDSLGQCKERVLQGKPYYGGPTFPVLSAAGAVWVEGLVRPRVRAALAWSIGVTAVGYGAALLPIGLPVVPPAPMARYAAAVGVTAATRTNTGGQLPLPQDYADMLGWRDKPDTVAPVVAILTPEERRGAVLYGANYGQAGALDLYGRRVGLPPVVSFAGSFFFFGPGDRPGDVIVLLGVELQEVESLECGSLELAARVANPWGVEEERDVPVLVCRRPNTTVQDLWAHRAAEPNEQ